MKKILFLAVFALFATISFAQDGGGAIEATPSETQTTGPTMTFQSTEIDYGTIEQHADPLRVFHFSNTGTEPLVIKHAKGSCGCTVPSYPKEPILPGEAAVIEVRYDTKRIGPFTKSITLTTNESSETHKLRIKGKVEPKPAEPDAVPASNSGFGGGK
ncbi:MAG: hypothetical protein ACI9XO_004444 [Paraglaciecola sp.]|jgi:hypothetical protein